MALNQNMLLTHAQALVGKAIGEHTTRQIAEFKSNINKDRQVTLKRMPLGARFSVNTHNVGGCFEETVKHAQWWTSPQETGHNLESIFESLQSRSQDKNQCEHKERWKDGKIGVMKSLRQNSRRAGDRQRVGLEWCLSYRRE